MHRMSSHMQRMMIAGYGERYRNGILSRALRIFDNMMEESEMGIKPLNRPREW